MKKNLQIMFNTFPRREEILTLYQDYTKEEIIEGAASLMDMNLDHPFAWNGMPSRIIKRSKTIMEAFMNLKDFYIQIRLDQNITK